MRVLISGIAGFIGGHIADLIASEGHDLLGIDNLSFGKREHVPASARLLELDLGTCDEAELFKAVRDFAPDRVIHFAAIHFIPHCMAHPDQTFASNVRGTEVLLRALEGTPVTKLVFASTMDVYDALDRVHCEDHTPRPCNVYGLSKWLGENLVNFHTRTNDNLSAVCLRFANAFGPRETNPHLIPDVLKRVRDPSLDVIPMGYLGATRDFIHVLDIAQAVHASLFQETGKFQVLNVGSGVDTPVRRVVDLIQQYAGDTRPIIEDKKMLRKFDRPSLSPDTTRIRQVLGWEPRWTLERGLQDLVAKEMASVSRG